MTCEKTGCWIRLEEYGAFIYGDLHSFLPNTLVMRATSDNIFFGKAEELEKMDGEVVWGTIHEIGEWFDRGLQYSTIIAGKATIDYHWNPGTVKFEKEIRTYGK